jgi:pimeloyl-ACP methyl ester carboxylesterase
MTAPLLVIHDHHDETVPFSHGADIARCWPGATLIGTTGLGHSGLLHDPFVISQVLDFVAAGSVADPRAALPGEGLEQELFNREARW